MDFSNKVAIITGSSSGIGQATAILFAKKGASVVLCGRNEARLQSSVDLCVEASGGHAERFTSVIGDLTEPEVRKSIVDKAIDTFQRLDILVPNAGVLIPEKGIKNISEALYDQIFNTNAKSVFFLIQTALPHLEKSQGNIVSVSSMGSTLAVPDCTAYAMTKASIDHMTRCLALELAPKGIRVNCVNPSYVKTNIVRNHGVKGKSVEETAELIDQMLKSKNVLYGESVTVEAVADSIAFLASNAAKFVTGQCLLVDGGRHYSGSK